MSTKSGQRNIPLDWQELSRLTHGEPITVERVRLAASGVEIEGSFELPQLARLARQSGGGAAI